MAFGPSQQPAASPGHIYSLSLVPAVPPGLYPPKPAAQCTRDVNHAGALFPAEPSFFELPGTGVFQVAALAFFAAPPIRHVGKSWHPLPHVRTEA